MTSTQNLSEKQRKHLLWALLFGNFVIGTGVMLVPGSLNNLSSSLQVSIASAGQLITAGAVLMCIGAPVFAAIIGGWDRRKLLAGSMLWYGALHALCALAPDYASVMVLRVLAMAAPAIFTPQAAAVTGLLVPPEQRGKAITMVFLGWSFASVLGAPMGAWISGTLGWRVGFGGLALLSIASAAWVWRALPAGVRPPALSAQLWRNTLSSKVLISAVAVTAISSAGQFVLFAYQAPYLAARLQATPGMIALYFAVFGAFGLIGNLLMSRNVDRLGAARAVLIALACMALSLLLWPLGSSFALLCLVTIPWALGCFSSNSAQQARLVAIAPGVASVSIALNTSAMYMGQGLGSGLGGWMIAQGRMVDLHWLAFIGLLCAMGVSFWAARLHQRDGQA
ncbi:MAG: MFS transporter [Burkholderiaceae bacterium]